MNRNKQIRYVPKATANKVVLNATVVPKMPPKTLSQAHKVGAVKSKRPRHRLAKRGTGALFIAVFGIPELIEMIVEAVHPQLRNYLRATCRFLRRRIAPEVRGEFDLIDYYAYYADTSEDDVSFINSMMTVKNYSMPTKNILYQPFKIDTYENIPSEYAERIINAIVKYGNYWLFLNYSLHKYPSIRDLIIKYDSVRFASEMDMFFDIHNDNGTQAQSDLINAIIKGKCYGIINEIVTSSRRYYPIAHMLPFVVFEDVISDIQLNRHVAKMVASWRTGGSTPELINNAIREKILPNIRNDVKYLTKIVTIMICLVTYGGTVDDIKYMRKYLADMFEGVYRGLNTGITWSEFIVDCICAAGKIKVDVDNDNANDSFDSDDSDNDYIRIYDGGDSDDSDND
ncbi:hypothetical protein F-LCD7_0202 [Faustovirus]|nr:hypothetical protein F-LCD7_0202 [Faustovirus]